MSSNYLLLRSGPAGESLVWLLGSMVGLSLVLFTSFLLLSLFYPFPFSVFFLPQCLNSFPCWNTTEMSHSYFSLKCIPHLTPNRVCGPMIASTIKGLPCQLKTCSSSKNRLWLGSRSTQFILLGNCLSIFLIFMYIGQCRASKYNDNVSGTREKSRWGWHPTTQAATQNCWGDHYYSVLPHSMYDVGRHL